MTVGKSRFEVFFLQKLICNYFLSKTPRKHHKNSMKKNSKPEINKKPKIFLSQRLFFKGIFKVKNT